MDKKMFRDYIRLESMMKVSSQTIGEMAYDISNLENYQRDLLEIIDEKNKDIADLHQRLREAEEKLMKTDPLVSWLIGDD